MQVFKNPNDTFEVEFYHQVDGKTVLILNNLIDNLEITEPFLQLAKMIGKEKVVMLNLHKINPIITYTDEFGHRHTLEFELIKRYWITGRGIGKSWWPHLSFAYEAKLGMQEDAAFLVKDANEVPAPVRASKKVFDEVYQQYGIDYSSYHTTNETQTSGFSKMYSIPFEETKKNKNYSTRIMLAGSFEALTKLAHRVNEAGNITRVYADELVSHNAKGARIKDEKWFDDYETSIYGSLFKKAMDKGLPYCFDAFMNKWDRKFPVISYADKYVDYTNKVRPYFLDDPINNHYMAFYIIEDKTMIVNASKFNSMVIRDEEERQLDLQTKLRDAIRDNNGYWIAAILGETYEGAEISDEYVYRNSIPEDYEYGLVEGSKEPVIDIGIDVDPNKIVVISASQLVWYNKEPHINVFPQYSIPVNFKGRYPTKEEIEQLCNQILEEISNYSMMYGLYIRSVSIDDNFGWLVGSVEGVALENGIEGITFDKPRQKKDDWNILTRQLFFNKFFPRGNIHFCDDESMEDLLMEFKEKRKQSSRSGEFKLVNKREDGDDHKINAWEYSILQHQYAFYGIDGYEPVQQDYIN